MRTPLLFLNVLIIATCGLVYELVAGTLASYVLGDSVTQFSICIGVYLSALGVGAWLSSFVDRPSRGFIEAEFAVAILGGFSAPLLFLSFAYLSVFHLVLYGMVFAIGTLVGLELPLLMRILRESMDFKELVSRVLTFDYIGALAGSLLFPILLVPQLGLVRTSLLFGLLNGVVGLWGTWLLRDGLRRGVLGLRIRGFFAIGLLIAGMVNADLFTTWSEDKMFSDPVVYSETSPYQRIVVTQGRRGFQLFLNNNLQFSSADEYRYHESLVHPAMTLTRTPRRVLILGGGDGLAMREVLKYDEVESVTLVDLDPAMTNLSRRFRPLAELNERAYADPRVHVINDDAMLWIEQPSDPFDVVFIDFPDPNNFALGKLYTRRFYRLLQRRVADDGFIGIQCTSPLFSRTSYWCIINTMESAGFHVRPYQVTVPSFGVWGFGLASRSEFSPPTSVRPGLKFLNDDVLRSLFAISNDISRVPAEVNRLDNQRLVQYYDQDWQSWK